MYKYIIGKDLMEEESVRLYLEITCSKKVDVILKELEDEAKHYFSVHPKDVLMRSRVVKGLTVIK